MPSTKCLRFFCHRKKATCSVIKSNIDYFIFKDVVFTALFGERVVIEESAFEHKEEKRKKQPACFGSNDWTDCILTDHVRFKECFFTLVPSKAAIMKSLCSSVTNVTYATTSVNHGFDFEYSHM